MHKRVAVLIDGGFFRKRYTKTYGPLPADPRDLASHLYDMVLAHAGGDTNDLYRIFYYDCPPLGKKAHNPVTNEAVNFSLYPQAVYQNAFLENLKLRRKVALRLGYLSSQGEWTIRPRYTKDILSGKLDPTTLQERDVEYQIRQKGVDMKIGVDIATLALKQLVGKIILVAGDADFVPAAKLARREGIDFVLDPMWNPIDKELYEHIDGLHSICPNPKKNQQQEYLAETTIPA